MCRMIFIAEEVNRAGANPIARHICVVLCLAKRLWQTCASADGGEGKGSFALLMTFDSSINIVGSNWSRRIGPIQEWNPKEGRRQH